jgi:hypothetical protein
MRTVILIALLSITSAHSFAASSLTCPSQLPAANNKLVGVTLYDEKDNTQYDLAPSSDKQVGQMTMQTWDGFTTEADVKTFVRCQYLNTEKSVTLAIPKTIKSCHFEFPYPDTATSKLKAKFECN